jgi:hypothetical protein
MHENGHHDVVPPIVLLDEWEENLIDQSAWVEKTARCDSSDKALAFVQQEFPPNEGVRYETTGRTVWLKPSEPGHWNECGEGEWEDAEPDDEYAREFWVVLAA